MCVSVCWGMWDSASLVPLRHHWDQDLADPEVPCDLCDLMPSLFLMLAVAACVVVWPP